MLWTYSVLTMVDKFSLQPAYVRTLASNSPFESNSSRDKNAVANTASGDLQAFVTDAQPQGMTIFRSYWNMRPSTAVVPPHPGTGNGGIASLESRAAILLHEVGSME